MQSNNNGNLEGAIVFVVLGIIIAIIQVIIAIALALAVIAAVGSTLLCLCAWYRPIRIAGEVLTPDEARAFILRGIIGGCGFSFVACVATMFGLPMTWNGIYFIWLVGYLYGSIGIALEQEKQAQERAALEAANKQQILPPITPPPTYSPPPFHFADWQDEDKLR